MNGNPPVPIVNAISVPDGMCSRGDKLLQQHFGSIPGKRGIADTEWVEALWRGT